MTIRDLVGNELHPGDVIAIPVRHLMFLWLEAWRIERFAPGPRAELIRYGDEDSREFSNFSNCVKICVPDGSQQ